MAELEFCQTLSHAVSFVMMAELEFCQTLSQAVSFVMMAELEFCQTLSQAVSFVMMAELEFYRGRTYAKKLRFLRKKRAGYANLKMPCIYCTQKTVTSHIKMRFRFLHPAEKVCRALALGLNILDISPAPSPLPSPSHPGEGMLVPTLRCS